MEVMQDQIYGQIFKMRALERWENEGGRAEPPETGRDEATRTEHPSRESVQKLVSGQSFKLPLALASGPRRTTQALAENRKIIFLLASAQFS